MAEIFPFPALRYNPQKVRLQDVVTQPYDKISHEMQERYYHASPYNLVRIILGHMEGQENERENRYTRASAYVKSWAREGILSQDNSPSIYAYSQTFKIPGTNRTTDRRGFIAAGRLHEYSDKIVFRHEQTLSKPKSDRLNLLRATRAHFGQIFMLYSDPAQSIDSLLFDDDHYAWQEVSDEYGVQHRMRRISDPAILNIVQTEMADKKLIIADGHHRYETALNFRNELATNGIGSLPNGAQSAMMTFVNMDAPGLVILPTHRVVHGLNNFNAEQFLARARESYDVKCLELTSADEIRSALTESGKKTNSFIAAIRDNLYLLAAKPHACDRLPAEFSPRQRRLDVVHLHALILEQLLGISREQITNQEHIRYLRDFAEGLDCARNDPAVNMVFLMNPVSIEQVREIAFSGEVLPQKSTDFFPKLLSGLTIYLVD
jgi:uncharacterized protein (DUF1015 family)